MSEVEIGLGAWTLESNYQSPRSWHDLYRRDLLDQVVRAEDLGFDCMWFGEHHHCYSGYLPSHLPAFASCVAASERIKICSGVLLLPLQGAARVAEGAAAIQAVAPGRIRLALAMGYSGREFAAGGVDRKRRGRLLDEHLDALIGEYRDRLGTSDLWIGAMTPRGVSRTARFGCSLYAQNVLDPIAMRQIRDQWKSELQPRDEHVPRIGLLNAVWVSEDTDAVRRARERWAEMSQHYALYVARDESDIRAVGGDPETLAKDGPRPLVAAMGSADEVVDQLGPLVTEAGVDALYLFVHTPMSRSGEVEHQLEVLAEKVVPQLRSLR